MKEEIVPEFKNDARIAEKETVIGLDGYAELEARLMRLMREEGQHAG